MAYYSKKNKNWVAQWQIDGIRRTKGGFSSKGNAERYERQQKIKQEYKLLGYPEQTKATIEEIFAKYLAWADDNKRPKEGSEQSGNLAHFLST